MHALHRFVDSPILDLLTKVALALVWLLFAGSHLTMFLSTGKPGLLAFAIAETVVASFLLLRTRPRSCSERPIEWIVAVVATFLPLLLRPTDAPAIAAAEIGLVVGSALQAASILSLNRSLALVPALRVLKTRGMYRFVRHPIYTSYLISFATYLLTNFSLHNALIVATSSTLLIARVVFEERHLMRSAEYRAYRERVRWRLIPFVL